VSFRKRFMGLPAEVRRLRLLKYDRDRGRFR